MSKSADYETAYLLDAELSEFLQKNSALIEQFKSIEPPQNSEQLNEERERVLSMAPLGNPEDFDVTRTEVFVPSDDGLDVRCLLYVPNNDAEERPGYLHLHGGGYIFGKPEIRDLENLQYSQALGAVICSVDYRMGPEDPTPAPLNDSYAALSWFFDNADSWNVDVSRIAIGGESAGGGMAAALAIHARDKGEYAICHQHLAYPMLDNRVGSAEYPGDPLAGEMIWTRSMNQYAWQCHLGDAPAVAPQVPPRIESYTGLPPTWMHTSSMDLFRDENVEFAIELIKAGVPIELHVIPGGPHGYDVFFQMQK